ncbi:MAG: hypothetical protein FVQ85_00095 [Planctomycetes bacterium]|nr:hypothetical protein [Planctomycetota bacterium]
MGAWKYFKRAGFFVWFSVVERVFARLNLIFLAVLVVWSVAAICLVVTHIFLVFNKTPPFIVQFWPNLILGWFGTSVANLKTAGNYGVIVADMIAVCAFSFAVLPLIQGLAYKVRLKRQVRDEFGFEFIPVKRPGDDDLLQMLKRYRGADHLTIFSGGFDWLGNKEKMKKEIVKLARDGKLRLVSFRSEEHVKNKFTEKSYQQFFDELLGYLKEEFRFESGLMEIKCSVIRVFGTEYRFLFRQSSNVDPFNAGFLSSSKCSRELLHILSTFTQAKKWGQPAVQFSPTGQGTKMRD